MAQAHRKTWKGAAIAAPHAATISPIFSQFTSSLPGLTGAGAGTTFCFIPQRKLYHNLRESRLLARTP